MKRARVIGTGSFLPEDVVTADEAMAALSVPDPKRGGVRDGAWLRRYFGIEEKRLGGFHGGERLGSVDLAERAARRAMADARLRPEEIDLLVHVACTPDELHFSADAIELHRGLGLREDARVFQLDAGCAGLAWAFDLAATFLEAGAARTALVVSANVIMPFFDRDRYVRSGAWLSLAVFGEGAGAAVLAASAEPEAGILARVAAVDGTRPLMFYRGGGARVPTKADTLDAHVYDMDAKSVKEEYPIAMRRNMEELQKLHPFRLHDFTRVYMHQASRPAIEGFAFAAGLPSERVAMNVHRLGNTVAASTLILLDEDRRAGVVRAGDLVLFLWVGAGLCRGGAVARL